MAKTPTKTRRKRRSPTLGPEKTAQLYAALAEDRPAPQTELDYHNPFTLVCTGLQASVKGLNFCIAGLD